MAEFPARLHVLLARDVPLAVVLRRGPSKSIACFSWRRGRDEFALGQWMKGRLFERRSDLSPDGKHLIYFAMNGRRESETGGAWTAISRAPYLKAIALFAKGDCWHGGGLWVDEKSYWLNDGYGHSVLRDTSEALRSRDYAPGASFGGECEGVYFPRLMRDGWRLVEHGRVAEWHRQTIFEKPCRNGWSLRKTAHAQVGPAVGKGCYWDEHQLVHAASGRQIHCPDWEWADLDRTRLVWASRGKLYAGYFRAAGITDQKELYDFNAQAFEAKPAPY